MPLPAMLAAAAPWVLSAIGTALPQIIDAFRSSPTPEEAQAKVAPEYEAMLARLQGGGMSRHEAEAVAKEQIAPALAQAQQKEPMHPVLSIGLSLLGGIGGYKAGAALGTKFGPKVMGTPPAATPSTVADVKGDTIPGVVESTPASAPYPRPAGPAHTPSQAGAIDDMHWQAETANDIANHGPFSRHRPKALDSMVEGERFDRMLATERPLSGHAQNFGQEAVQGQRFEHMLEDESMGYAAQEAAKGMGLSPFPPRRGRPQPVM